MQMEQKPDNRNYSKQKASIKLQQKKQKTDKQNYTDMCTFIPKQTKEKKKKNSKC